MKIFVEINDTPVPVDMICFAAYIIQTFQRATTFPAYNWQPDQVPIDHEHKIAAIKLLRAMPGHRMGLAEAKRILDFVVENWDEVRQLGRLTHSYIL